MMPGWPPGLSYTTGYGPINNLNGFWNQPPDPIYNYIDSLSHTLKTERSAGALA